MGSGVTFISTMHVVGWGGVGVGQNESGGAKKCTGHFYLHVIREPVVSIIFIFPLEQGKENDAPFIVSSLASIPVNQRQKCHLTHFSPPAPTHSVHVPGLDATQVSK